MVWYQLFCGQISKCPFRTTVSRYDSPALCCYLCPVVKYATISDISMFVWCAIHFCSWSKLHTVRQQAIQGINVDRKTDPLLHNTKHPVNHFQIDSFCGGHYLKFHHNIIKRDGCTRGCLLSPQWLQGQIRTWLDLSWSFYYDLAREVIYRCNNFHALTCGKTPGTRYGFVSFTNLSISLENI